ncbi:intradiol ring-cleavage dioxygenase [Lysobacteraceae bacterium NML120232]|nr:intradiol ring-cleavage dioxygenase [Xanthomonadaceae bacterium NML120232]
MRLPHLPQNPHRRRLLKLGGMALIASQTGLLAACSKVLEGSGNTVGTTAATGRWTSGGTAMIAKAGQLPNPFDATLGNACQLTCEATIGPCHTHSVERRDISDGWDGLPLCLMLRVLDENCQPVPDVIVEIWHTNYTGGYSGQIQRMCNNNQDDLDKQFFRGYQRTDAAGIARFDTCYPGWYRGRAVHIHVRVQTGEYQADDHAPASVITQFLFSDALNQEIFTGHVLYSGYGQPDTTLDTDNVVGGESDKSPYILDVQRLDNGVMLASKTLIVRREDGQPLCRVKGAHGQGGPGGRRGPPPDGQRPDGPPPDGPPPAH